MILSFLHRGREGKERGGGFFPWILWTVSLSLLLFSGCSCPRKKKNPVQTQSGCITSDAQGLLLRLDPTSLLLHSSNPQPVTSTLRVTPVLEGGVPLSPGGEERYYLDEGADGNFEGEFFGRVTEIVRAQPGRYPFQVTAQRCDGEILSARTQLQVLGTKPPVLSVSFNPPFQSWLPIGVNLCAFVSAEDPDGSKEMDLTVSFGEGAPVTRHQDFGTEAVAQFCHTYPRKGLFRFSATATDAQGDVSTYTRDLLIVLGILPVGTVEFGESFRDLEFFGEGTDTTFFLMAGGGSGVLAYGVDRGGGIHFLSRLSLAPDSAEALRLDPRRRMAFVASGKAGGYFVDITDPSRVHLIYPNVFYPANARDGVALVDRVFLCQGGDWLIFRNRSLGLHFIEFKGENKLQDIRNGGAPRRENSPYFDFEPPLFSANPPAVPYDNVLLEPNARGVACLVTGEDKWVAVSSGGSLKLYRAPTPSPVTEIPLPQATLEIPPRGEGVTGVVDPDGSLRFFVAMGEHGFAEFRVVTAPTLAVSLAKHLYVYLSGLFFGNTYDRILDLFYEPDRLLSFVTNSDLSLHAFMRFDLNQWPVTFSAGPRPYPYRNAKCDLNEVRGILNNGDTYSDMRNCFSSPESFRFAGKTESFLWMRTSRGGAGVEPSNSSLQGGTYYTNEEISLPEVISWYSLPVSTYLWIGKGKKLEVYDYTALESGLSQGFQPPPSYESGLSIVVERVTPVLGTGWEGDLLLSNGSELLWVTVDARGIPYPQGYNNTCSGCFLEVSAKGGGGIARNLLDGTLRNFTLLRGSGIQLGNPSSEGGYKGLFACGNDFFALREGGVTLYRVGTLTPIPWIENPGGPAKEFTYHCYRGNQIVYAGLNPSLNQAEIRIYPAPPDGNTPNPFPLWSFDLPYPPFSPPSGIAVVPHAQYLGVFLKGQGYGLVFFDPAKGSGEDALLGVDLDGNAGIYENPGIFTTVNGVRLLALSPTTFGPRKLLIKEIR